MIYVVNDNFLMDGMRPDMMREGLYMELIKLINSIDTSGIEGAGIEDTE